LRPVLKKNEEFDLPIGFQISAKVEAILMKISHTWLQKLIHLPESTAQVSAILTGLGLEVEGIEAIEKIKGNLDGVVIGEVLTCEKHPDADKLKITTVNIGTNETLHIVCGAPNVAVGQKVVVATIGTTLYPVEGDSIFIKKSKIRGQLSEGMICAEDELGLGKSHDGILVLETNLPLGTSAARYFNLEATPVYEIGLTPNRADAASHFGVARDLKAFLNRPVIFPESINVAGGKLPNPIEIEIQNSDSCPRYAGLYIRGLKVGSSPEWMQESLRSIGLNPINNLVDITNYVLHELGQPMHAFDASKIEGRKIVVRNAKDGETLTTLDKVERKLRPEDLVIADANKPLALAGVFGGLGSGVTSETSEILLESAYFHPVIVRKSAQFHGLKTDSSFRFERGTDPNMVIRAMERAAFLIQEFAGATVEFAVADAYPKPIEDKKFVAKWRNINRLIGEDLPRERVYEILNLLEIEAKPIAEYGHEGFEEEFEVSVPAYRVDVEREADIVEDILRVYGIDNIKIDSDLSTDFISSRAGSKVEKVWVRASQFLADSGFVEIITNSLSQRTLTAGLEEFKDEDYVEILNPLSEDLGVMRQTLLFSGLEVLAYNINRRQNNLKLFQLGKVYKKTETGTDEGYRLGLYTTGQIQETSWENKSGEIQYFYLKKWVVNLFARLGISQIQFRNEITSAFEFGQSIYLKNQKIGELGLLKNVISKRKEVKQSVFASELNWDLMMKLKSAATGVKEISKFPEVRRDLSVVIDKSLTFDKIENLVKASNKQLIKSTSVFDVYHGDKIDAGKKAYALSIILQDENQTLTDSHIDKTMDNIIRKLELEIGAIIRR
jgi:phenylalanyl-tRNA synthetase beta chain